MYTDRDILRMHVRHVKLENNKTHPSSSHVNSFFASLIKSTLKAILNACCELISYLNMIPSDFVAAISLRKVSRALGVSLSAALRGIILRLLCGFFVEKCEFNVLMAVDAL